MKKAKTKKRTHTDTKSKNMKGGMETMVIGATGAIVGAALGTAAAIALANEKTRKMLTQKVGEFTDEAVDVVDKVSQNSDINYSTIRKQIGKKKK